MGVLLALSVVLAIAFTILCFVTQIAIPLSTGGQFFPAIRSRIGMRAKIAAAKLELEQTSEYVSLQSQLNDLNRRKAHLEIK